jgi:colanic acid biosynthesis glycosyl transferase WcaI
MSPITHLIQQTSPYRPATAEGGTKRRPRVLFLNRSYWPDGEATGQLLTELAEDLAGRFEVTVVAGLPNTNPAGERYRVFVSEMRRGVRILRVPHTRFPKGWLPGRAVNFVSFLGAAAIRAALCRRQDVVVVETDPFLLPFLGLILRWRHQGRLIVYLQDIHPEIGVAVGRLQESLLTRSLQRSLRAIYRRADRVVVLSRDMRRTLMSAGVPEQRIDLLPNWIDANRVRPTLGRNRFRARHGIADETFLVMYSGNWGVTQQLEQVIEAAERLRGRHDVLFAFVGGGTAEASLREEVARRELMNVRFFPYQPKEELGDSLSAADLHLLTVHPAALNYLMPSKLYGILAVGRPLLAAVPRQSELAEEILTSGVGDVIEPGDVEAMVQIITEATTQCDALREKGRRGRLLAESRYDRPLITRQFGEVIDSVMSGMAASAKPDDLVMSGAGAGRASFR